MPRLMAAPAAHMCMCPMFWRFGISTETQNGVLGSVSTSPDEAGSMASEQPTKANNVPDIEAGTEPLEVEFVEAPVTAKAYLTCAFAAFGGIFFGYDNGYIAGVIGMDYVVSMYTGLPKPGPGATAAEIAAFVIPSWQQSLITSILSVGTFFGSIIAGDLAELYGRRTTIILGCVIFMIGTAMQTASTEYKLLVAGRAIAGLGVGFESAIVILYMSEIAPRKIRGALIAGYQFCITIGLLISSCVSYAFKDKKDSSSYRVPIGLQFAWAIILAVGLALLPESPRYYVKKGMVEKARNALVRIRGQPEGPLIEGELGEIVANYEYERALVPDTYLGSWAACFSGGWKRPNSNLRLTLLGVSLQMMQQLTGISFIFYFGTVFFQQLGTIDNPFLITLIVSLVNVLSTPVSFWSIEKFGRRPLMIWGAAGMVICEFLVAILGVTRPNDMAVSKAQISFICIYIFFFANTWGPGAWVLIGEIFPVPIRSRGVALSTASTWLWACVIAVISPYMTSPDKGNLGSKVFFIWGSLCAVCFLYAYFLIWETKGLTLEQVDQMMEEVGTPRKSAGWKPSVTYAQRLESEKKHTIELVEKAE